MTVIRFPWDDDEEQRPPPPLPPPLTPSPVVQGRGHHRRPVAAAQEAGRTEQGFLFHHLTVFGPGNLVDRFAAGARGPGVIPWRVDYAELEEDIFHMSLRQPPACRTLSVSECRTLARQFSGQVEAHHARAAALAATTGRHACPFDLHVLLPIPERILSIGPRDPRAAAWLRSNWGVVSPPRQVVSRPGATAGKRLPGGHRVVGYGFFCEGGTPHAAREALERIWTGLSFRLVVRTG